jgi:hypothetical protein
LIYSISYQVEVTGTKEQVAKVILSIAVMQEEPI